jgi:LmbE family N-acetylglucosaminyl deacetylase
MIGIFAHPDDGTFGPGGTFALAAQNGFETHMICATCGDAGINDKGHDDLATVREAEEREAGEILGISSHVMLRLGDGQLCNNAYLPTAERLLYHLRDLTTPEDDVTLVTFAPDGLTGHLDHIFMSLVTTYCYLKLRGERRLQLKYFVIPAAWNPTANTDWLYMPKGRDASDIDEIIDVRAVRDQKVAAIRAHRTQTKDADTHLSRGDELFDEHFTFYKD